MFANKLYLGKAREHVFYLHIHNTPKSYPQQHDNHYKSYPQSYPQTHTPILYYLAIIIVCACVYHPTRQDHATRQGKTTKARQQHTTI